MGLVALPVAYMLVQSIGDASGTRSKLRTKLGCGFITEETRTRITENGTWQFGGIVGPFKTQRQAELFLQMWKEGASSFASGCVTSRTVRGPTTRMSRAMALATILGVEIFIDFLVVSNCKPHNWSVCATGDSIVAKPRLV